MTYYSKFLKWTLNITKIMRLASFDREIKIILKIYLNINILTYAWE